MSVTKLIRDRTKILDGLDARFKEVPTAKTLQARLGAVNDQQEARIAARIKTLETEKATALARYDAAIKSEQSALAELKQARIDLTRIAPGKASSGKTTGKTTTKAKATTKAKTATKAATKTATKASTRAPTQTKLTRAKAATRSTGKATTKPGARTRTPKG
ncbi:hypothetical protein [Poseidonocella sedimentorum]|uniref:Uncharacterized protein n=1 Tax=Poseidonocella sedimentorum TaxID=871652 RepID=A0A1I6DPG4_9RHOB|nr:hypothetical protein [Poseidonocella sedimentorum]SFR07316.1 hypothetical protein SAMN04515673_104210 [Poseidonocella sedimentorum]